MQTLFSRGIFRDLFLETCSSQKNVNTFQKKENKMLSFSLHCTPKEAIIERITLYAALIQFFDRNSNTTQVSFIMNTKDPSYIIHRGHCRNKYLCPLSLLTPT